MMRYPYLVLILALGIASLFIDIKLKPDIPLVLLGFGTLFLCFSLYIRWRLKQAVRLEQVPYFLGLWLLFAAFGVKPSYFGASLNFPLRDELLQRLDATIGFNWLSWATLLSRHQAILDIQEFAYVSTGWQPVIFLLYFSAINQKPRNEELLASMAIGLWITTLIFPFMPVVGPADIHHMHTETGDIIRALRAHAAEPLRMTGIVSFPSYHTCMAILYTAAHRGLWSFWPVLCLNMVVLSAVPYTGDHYLTDMPAGALVAAFSYLVTRYIRRRANLPQTGSILVSVTQDG